MYIFAFYFENVLTEVVRGCSLDVGWFPLLAASSSLKDGEQRLLRSISNTETIWTFFNSTFK
jgi:hypothetical protein